MGSVLREHRDHVHVGVQHHGGQLGLQARPADDEDGLPGAQLVPPPAQPHAVRLLHQEGHHLLVVGFRVHRGILT